MPQPSVRTIVLAAGAGSRFGGGKLLARFGRRPILQHVLDRLAEAGVDDPVVVLGRDAELIEAAIDWRSARRVVNPDPEGGLASSLRLGWAAARDSDPDAVLVVLGDQPLLRPDLVRQLLAADVDPVRPIVAVAYAGSGSRNPVRIERQAGDLVEAAAGDHGLGPLLEAQPELLRTIVAAGDNPDVDAKPDLVALAEADWADRVERNREQVERLREIGPEADHYAPVSATFRDDPHRTGDLVVEALRRIARPDHAWLDVGAGAGRYALPLALSVRQVIAVDPSPSMLDGLRAGMAEHAITNVRVVEGRWPAAAANLAPMPCADVALIAHVSYDVSPIGPFLDALEAAARRTCVAVLFDEAPSSAIAPFWPIVYGEERVLLPGLADFLELLRARGADPSVERFGQPARTFPSRDVVLAQVRRQTWVRPGGERDARLQRQLDGWLVESDGGVALRTAGPRELGIVTWQGAHPLTS
jgi:CTP:molybdopterin cytidylyltransferase MocA/SAM-dependent methyltransferase